MSFRLRVNLRAARPKGMVRKGTELLGRPMRCVGMRRDGNLATGSAGRVADAQGTRQFSRLSTRSFCIRCRWRNPRGWRRCSRATRGRSIRTRRSGWRITSEKRSFEAHAVVVYFKTGMGMGLVFTTVEPEQLLILDRWLAELSGAIRTGAQRRKWRES